MGKTKNGNEMDIYKKVLFLSYGFPLTQTRHVNQLSNVLAKYPRQSNQKGKVYFGSWLQRCLSIVTWSSHCCACGGTEYHGREYVGQSYSPIGNLKEGR